MNDKETLAYYHNMVITRIAAAVQHLDNHEPLECRYALRLLQLNAERLAEYSKIENRELLDECEGEVK